jgi:Cdc6-like AAA superfamily ATPase
MRARHKQDRSTYWAPFEAAAGADATWSVAQDRSPAAMSATASPLARPNGELSKSVPLAAAPPAAATAGEPPAGAPPHAAAGNGKADDTVFTLAAPGVSWIRGRPAPMAAAGTSAALRDAFTPTRPKQDTELFYGRFEQLRRIIAAIEQERAHVMIYGERGSGKTSLANILANKAGEAGYLVVRLACSSELTFEDIFRSFLRRMPANLLLGDTNRDNLEQLLPSPYSLFDLLLLFKRIGRKHVILIIDEYDRIAGEETKEKLAELIKQLSDADAPVTLLLVGVAETVDQLLGKHPSLQRTVVAVPLPPMTDREIDGIVTAGEMKSGLNFDVSMRQAIVDFAQGLPYHAQLLCLLAADSAMRRCSNRVEPEDLRYAVLQSAERAEARTKETYGLAVGPQESASLRDALFHAARCRTDESGSFAVADVVAAAAPSNAPAPSLLSLQYPLKKLTEPERGAVLRRVLGPGGWRYQFSSQTLRHYVLCRQAEQRGLIGTRRQTVLPDEHELEHAAQSAQQQDRHRDDADDEACLARGRVADVAHDIEDAAKDEAKADDAAPER